MKALFIRTASSEVDNHIQAWNSLGEKAVEVLHAPAGLPADDEILEAVKATQPKVIFYISACTGFGLPSVHTLQTLRKIAPVVNLCSDAADQPWWPMLDYYRRKECFDLQVSIDGARNEHVDHAAITPVDPGPFETPGPAKDILCGFSGSADHGQRAKIVGALKLRSILTHRHRRAGGTYADHVAFLRRCVSTINLSITGSGKLHHIKGRVLEAGWAGAALIESKGSPIADWFPEDTYLIYDRYDGDATAALFSDRARLAEYGARLGTYVRAHYTPAKIYGGILERIGLTLNVDTAHAQPAA